MRAPCWRRARSRAWSAYRYRASRSRSCTWGELPRLRRERALDATCRGRVVSVRLGAGARCARLTARDGGESQAGACGRGATDAPLGRRAHVSVGGLRRRYRGTRCRAPAMARSAFELVSRRARRHGAGRMQRVGVESDAAGCSCLGAELAPKSFRVTVRGSTLPSGRTIGTAAAEPPKIRGELMVPSFASWMRSQRGGASSSRGSTRAGIAAVEQLVEDRRGALGVVERVVPVRVVRS